MLWTLKILIFQHCFCLDITVLLENCCQKELVIIDILRSRESLLLWPCFNLFFFFFFYNFLLIIRRIGESGIMEPSMRSWGDVAEEWAQWGAGGWDRQRSWVQPRLGNPKPTVKLVFWVSIWGAATQSSSQPDSRLWNSSSGVLPLFASETSICISVNVIIMTQGKVTQEATFKHIIFAQSST